MTAELHPLLHHHIVNSLGWRSLRPMQQRALPPVSQGNHTLVIAPTAGGKTEAAVFPLLSRQLTEDWRGLSILYLCPLRALLNNLHPRIAGYAGLVGRRAGLWHGDVRESKRGRIRIDPPDVLLTTPESIEAMLISSKTDHAWLFRSLRVVVVDEIHAFAGDDRGWHLLSVVQRLERLAGRTLQRVGLSATVGDPTALLDWVCGPAEGERTLVAPEPRGSQRATEVTLDHVGSIGNAATVISRLHRGEKRLVFVDSRARAEQLTNELRLLGTRTWLSHGSLGRSARAEAEEAFATAPEGVIVATSTMELGIDVGDLDRVIQLDAPWTVASFLQRLGRTGRRDGTVANCLLLTTSDRALINALGLLTVWADGWVEPVEPPPLPLHLIVQQILALVRQEGAVGRGTWSEWLGDPLILGQEVAERLSQIVDHLVDTGVLSTDGDMLQLGPQGEQRYGRRNFLDLTAVFADPPTLSVVHGPEIIGTVHVTALLRAKTEDVTQLLIAGRIWAVHEVDWRRRQVLVQPASGQAKTAWTGDGVGMSAVVAAGVRIALMGQDPPGVRLSQRATIATGRMRERFHWLDDEHRTYLVHDPDGTAWWWTFAGSAANDELSRRAGSGTVVGGASGLAIRVEDRAGHDVLERARTAEGEDTDVPDDLDLAWKFSDALPGRFVVEQWRARARDSESVELALGHPPVVRRLRAPGPRP